MNLAFFLLFLAAGLFFVLVEQAFLAGLSFIAALLTGLVWFFSRTARLAKATGKGLAKGIPEEVSKAETGSPDFAVLEESFKNAADTAGQQLYARDSQQFRFKGVGALQEASQRLMDLFKKAFK